MRRRLAEPEAWPRQQHLGRGRSWSLSRLAAPMALWLHGQPSPRKPTGARPKGPTGCWTGAWGGCAAGASRMHRTNQEGRLGEGQRCHACLWGPILCQLMNQTDSLLPQMQNTGNTGWDHAGLFIALQLLVNDFYCSANGTPGSQTGIHRKPPPWKLNQDSDEPWETWRTSKAAEHWAGGVCVVGGVGGGCDFCSIFVPSPDISSWSPLILHLCFHLLISSPQIL